MKLFAVLVACVSFFFVPAGRGAGPVISEIMADNTRTLADEDAEYPDWIEIHNPLGTPVNLVGWRLTDDPEQLAKWTFPSVNVPAGGYLVVFASAKNRIYNPAKLHTNFQLDSTGEYLALVEPDGRIAHQLAPAYPSQLPDISYGSELVTTTVRLVTNGASVRWTVPQSALDWPADWAATNFLDAAWFSGRTAIGFDLGPSNVIAGGTATNVSRGKAATQSSTLSPFTANLAVNGTTADFTHTAAGQNLPASWTVNLGTNFGIEQILLRNRGDCCGSRLRDVTVRILGPGGETNFASPLLNPENTLSGPATITVDLVQLTGGAVVGSQVRVTRTPDPDLSGSGGVGNADEADVLSLAEVEVVGVGASGSFNSLVRTDVASAMRNVNASALIRVPFQVVGEELPPLAQLNLRMNYDDGFVAYLNGMKVAEANAPAGLSWNSGATAEHPDAAGFAAQTFNLAAFTALLRDGENILAIQGLNVTAADDDFLVLPELTGISEGTPRDRYFTQPTPGAVNTVGSLGFVADTKFSVDRGFYSAPFSVIITTDTADATIRYTTNGSAPSDVSGLVYTGPIAIDRTTVLRAMATKPGYTSSDVDTHTYVFLNQVVAQSHTSVTNAGYPNTWASVAADYAMDTRITSTNTANMVPSLRSLPSMFISTSISNMFHATGGIYAQPTTHGFAWERPASIELVDTNGVTEFQEDAGLRIQGGYFRDANVTQKHSLRVLFKGLYGAGKLRHNLFKTEGATEEFDGFVLRAGANDGYAWNAAKDTEQFTRVQFGQDLHISMGHASPHGIFVQLYLNGVYWGLYNLVERANEDFSASYYGGEALEWDANNAGEVKSGDLTAWNTFVSLTQTATGAAGYHRVQGNNADGTRNPAFPVYLDKLNYIDYMIANIWGGNWDWPNKNFWFGRHRGTNSTGFKFYVWDFENTMGNDRNRSPTNMVSPRSDIANTWVGQPHYNLRNNLEYRLDFADRVQRYFFNDGLLTTSVLTNRYRQLADWIEQSIYAETARWGDDNLNPPQDIEDWRREREWMLNTYLQVRSGIVLGQFRAAGFYPSVGAPFFSSYGGFVGPEAQLTITQTNSGGTIYYTADGSDPRKVGGDLAPTALVYTAPVSIGGNALVQSRVRVGTNWSALVRGDFSTAAYFKNLAVSEIMYNPAGTTNVGSDEFEFVELKNTGTTELNLSGLSFSSGITFAFPNNTRLAPGAFFVLARNPGVFQSRYPGVAIHGVFSGRLDNGGETLRLSHVIGGSIFGLTYADNVPWPLAADGHGFSIVPVTLATNLNSDNPARWRASAVSGGSPGTDDPAPSFPGVVINEVLTHTALGQDFIELYNPSGSPAAVGGWFLTDDRALPAKFRVPDGTTIPAGGFVIFTEADFNPTPGLGNSFTLDAENEQVFVFSGNAAGNLTGYSHGFAFGAAPEGVTFGRHLLSTGEEQFPLQSSPTPGQPNAGPRIGAIVISEVHYNPRPGDDAFVELKNLSGATLALYDLAVPTNGWRINGVDFSFPEGATIPAGGFVVVCESQPAAFRARYNVPAGVAVFGPYGGTLQDSGERLELQYPDLRAAGGVAYVTLDEVRFNDRAPWPSAADGIGPSLQRQTLGAYGNEPLNWRAASPTPGRDFLGGTSPTITQNPTNVTVVATREAIFSVAASGPGPLSYQWRYNGTPLPGATNSLLMLSDLQLIQAGGYSAVVYNDAGAVESAPATLTVLTPARFTQQPADALVRIRPDPTALPTTNATFIAVVSSTSPITYQWRFNGQPISGATSASITVTDVQLSDEGVYSVAVTDSAGTVFSRDARLIPLITPVIVQQPVSQTAVPGSTVTLSVAVTGSPRPFSFEWRRGSAGLLTNVSGEAHNFFSFTVTNAPPTNITYRVIVKNLANSAPGVASAFATNYVVADVDGDRLADAWESQFGFNPGSAADANLDSDGDGLTNREEYEAGTDPRDGASYLKVRLDVANNSALVSFGAASNKTYSVLYTGPLGVSWQKLADVVARTTNRLETLVDPGGNPERYYRIVTPQNQNP